MLHLQFVYGKMSADFVFLYGIDSFSGIIYVPMIPDSKKMDMSYVVATTVKWGRDLTYERVYVRGKTWGSSVVTGQM